MPTDPKTPLDYEHRANVQPLSNIALKFAFFTAALPMAAGGTITLAYVITWSNVLPPLGLWCIFGGIVSVFAGAIALGQHCFERRRRRLPIPISVPLIALLFFLNVPACFVCMTIGASLIDHYEVVVINQMSEPMTNVSITMARFPPVLIGTIPSGDRKTAHFELGPDGAVTGSAVVRGSVVKFDVDAYVTGSTGPIRKTVRFSSPTTQPTVE